MLARMSVSEEKVVKKGKQKASVIQRRRRGRDTHSLILAEHEEKERQRRLRLSGSTKGRK